MVTASQKIKKETAAPVAKTLIKIGNTERQGPPALGKMVVEAFEIKQEMDILKSRLADAQAKIIERAAKYLEDATGTVNVICENVKATVSVRDNVTIADPEALEAVLGDRFLDLVREKCTYAPERKLIEMACDGDDPLRDDVARCLTVKENKMSVTYSVV